MFYINILAIVSYVSAYAGADESQRLTQLKLALTWNRVDIAQEEIFREDVHWKQGKIFFTPPLLLIFSQLKQDLCTFLCEWEF